MLLPNKYVGFNKSYVCIAACVFDVLGEKKYSVEKLWERFSKKYPSINYNFFIKTLVFLKICQYIDVNSEGELFNENSKNNL